MHNAFFFSPFYIKKMNENKESLVFIKAKIEFKKSLYKKALKYNM